MNDFVELRSVIATVFRRWWLIGLIMLVFGALGYFISIRQTPIYQATTSLMVGRPIQSTEIDRFDIQTSQQLAQTYAELATRQPVLQKALDEQDMDHLTWTQLRNMVRPAVSSDTQLLEIRVESSSKAEAVALADEIARQLILVSPSGAQTPQDAQAQEFAEARVAELRGKVAQGQTQLADLETEMISTTSAMEVARLQTQMATLEGLVSRWEENYLRFLDSLDNKENPNNLTVLEEAQGGSRPIRPNTRLNTIIAILAGMVLALGLIFLLEFLDDTLRSPEDIDRSLGLPTVGAINRIKGKNLRDALIVNHDPFSPAYEDYRLLRTKVQFMSVDGRGRVVVVTSAGRGEGKSITTANLGIVMAQAGLKTVVIDANLRQPVLHDIFRLPNQTGLTHVLRSHEMDVDSFLQQTLVPNLKVLVSGPATSNPSELLGSDQMGEMLDKLVKFNDVILCDTVEAVTVADASVLSHKTDGVLLVIDSGETHRDAARQAVANLHDARADILGCVLNRISSKDRVVVFSGASETRASEESGRPGYVDSPSNA